MISGISKWDVIEYSFSLALTVVICLQVSKWPLIKPELNYCLAALGIVAPLCFSGRQSLRTD
jgi:hypothetical protein